MRQRSLAFTTWILGFGIALSWILLSQVTLNLTQKIIFTTFVVLLGSFTIIFLYSIEKGFNSNRKVIIKLEEALGCYRSNEYCDNEPLFPEDYKNLKRKGTWHFISLYIWISLISVLLIIFIWFDPICNVTKHI